MFPLVLIVIHRFRSGWLPASLWIAAILSLALSVHWLRLDPSRAFYYPWPRAFELLIGAIVAVGGVPPMRSAMIRTVAALFGLVLIIGSFVLLSNRIPFPGLAVLPACTGAALILAAGESGPGPVGRMLGLPPLVLIGSLSYSLYLWHWPALVFGRYILLRPFTPFEAALALSCAFIVAWLSWRFVERPALARRWSTPRVTLVGGAAMATGIAAAAAILATGGVPQRIDRMGATMLAAAKDRSGYRPACHSEEHKVVAYGRLCRLGDPDAVPDILLWGDSLGAELVVAIGENLRAERRAILQATASACPPALGFDVYVRPRCQAYNDRRLAELSADPRIGRVVLVANYLAEGVTSPTDRALLLDGIERSVWALRRSGKAVTLVYPIPRMPLAAPTALAMTSMRGGDIGGFGQERADFDRRTFAISQRLDRIVAQTGAARIIPAQRLCTPRLCPAWLPGIGVLYYDQAHPSITGGRRIFAGMRL